MSSAVKQILIVCEKPTACKKIAKILDEKKKPKSLKKDKVTFYQAHRSGVELNVVSAKYIGWNPSHKQYEKISNKLYEEYCTNLQGNIILTYMSGIYPKDIFNFFTNDYSGSNLNQHNFSA